jgi:hypothetical protein
MAYFIFFYFSDSSFVKRTKPFENAKVFVSLHFAWLFMTVREEYHTFKLLCYIYCVPTMLSLHTYKMIKEVASFLGMVRVSTSVSCDSGQMPAE